MLLKDDHHLMMLIVRNNNNSFDKMTRRYSHVDDDHDVDNDDVTSNAGASELLNYNRTIATQRHRRNKRKTDFVAKKKNKVIF